MTSATSEPTATPAAPRSRLAWGLATCFGIGFLQPGSGTWASAVTVLLWWLVTHLRGNNPWVTAAIALLITAIGIPLSGTVARESGRHDPGSVVIDEVAGQLIALIAVPLRWQYVLASFILFRSFDIWKPAPLRALERLRGGWGIMLDDVGAGLYALILLQVWNWFIHGR